MRIQGTQTSDKWVGRRACFLEIGYGKPAYVPGNFLAERKTQLDLRMPSWRSYLRKVFFEKYWLCKLF
jgi:hypothetical protein